MAKAIEKDGKFYRMRRGKLVEIPPEWKGKVTGKKTKRDRKTFKAAAKQKPLSSWSRKGPPPRKVVKHILENRSGHHNPDDEA